MYGDFRGNSDMVGRSIEQNSEMISSADLHVYPLPLTGQRASKCSMTKKSKIAPQKQTTKHWESVPAIELPGLCRQSWGFLQEVAEHVFSFENILPVEIKMSLTCAFFPYCEQQPTELAFCFSQREMQGLELIPALARRETELPKTAPYINPVLGSWWRLPLIMPSYATEVSEA